MADALASWNDTPTRQAVADFVESAARDVPPAERIATFDNDGTLWCEKPMPIELVFILKRLASMAEKDESLRAKQPWQAAYEKDYAWLGDVITKHYASDDSQVKVLMGGILQAFAGATVDDYGAEAGAFVREQPHPTLGRLLRDCGYLPMIELLRFLEANGFTNYIASGGDRDFMRPTTDEIYGIPPEQVIGSSNGLQYTENEDGGQIEYLAEPDVFDDGPTKPVRIWSRVGKATGPRGRQLERRHPDARLGGRRQSPDPPAPDPARRHGARVRLRVGIRGGARAGEGRRLDGRERQGRLGDGVRRPRSLRSRGPASDPGRRQPEEPDSRGRRGGGDRPDWDLPGEQTVAYAVFALVGTLGVAVPVVIYFALGDRAGPILDRLRTWMAHDNAVIMAVLCLVVGAKLVGDALTGFSD